MAGEKRFGSAMFGFNKADVNYYIEKILKEFDDRLKEKDQELDALKLQNREIKVKYEELARKSEQVNEDRAKIAEVLIKANEKAEMILAEARNQALEEKRQLEDEIESQKEILVDYKQKVRNLKIQVLDTLKRFDGELDSIAEIDQSEDEAAAASEE